MTFVLLRPSSVGDRRPMFGILSCCYQPGSEAPGSPSTSLWPPSCRGGEDGFRPAAMPPWPFRAQDGGTPLRRPGPGTKELSSGACRGELCPQLPSALGPAESGDIRAPGASIGTPAEAGRVGAAFETHPSCNGPGPLLAGAGPWRGSPPTPGPGSPALGSLRVPRHHLSDGPGSLQLWGHLAGS